MFFAVDLDNTLIYSYKKNLSRRVCVEWKEEKELSYMTPTAHNLLKEAVRRGEIVPLTSRSVEQYRRISFFPGYQFPFALVCNGAILLRDGEIDEKWREESLRMVEPAMGEVEKARQILETDPDINFEIRLIDGLWLFTKSENPKQTISRLQNALNGELVWIMDYKEKINVVPHSIDKGEGLRRFMEFRGDYHAVCAGDSVFDLPMLKKAKTAVIPDVAEIKKALGDHSDVVVCEGEETAFSDGVLRSILRELDKRS